VRPFVWTHGAGRFLADLADCGHLDEQGRRLADEVQACRAEAPGRPVYLVGHSSGCAVCLRAAENLPPDSVERVLLIAPAVSAWYDLRPALRACRAVEVFYSRRDWFYLGLGSTLLGGSDRRHDPAAGHFGFWVPSDAAPEDAALLTRLRQYPWAPPVTWTGNHGGHSGAFRPDYLRAFVLPLLTPVQDHP
jgi:pimeloyl-ACP methyl ester carboxylesterase